MISDFLLVQIWRICGVQVTVFMMEVVIQGKEKRRKEKGSNSGK